MFTVAEILEFLDFNAKYFLENACEHIGQGAYRNVYRVKYTHFVIKADRCCSDEEYDDFPCGCSCDWGNDIGENTYENGNVDEWCKYQNIRHIPNIDRFVSKIYAISQKGKFLIAEFVPLKTPGKWNKDRLRDAVECGVKYKKYVGYKLEDLLTRLLRIHKIDVEFRDLHYNNVRRRAGSKYPVIIDLGC